MQHVPMSVSYHYERLPMGYPRPVFRPGERLTGATVRNRRWIRRWRLADGSVATPN